MFDFVGFLFWHPAAEIEQVTSLFQEKQAELQTAVLRVEQLSLQLEDLRRGKLNGIQTGLGGQVTGAAALELRKLYQELQVMLCMISPLTRCLLCFRLQWWRRLCSSDSEQAEPGAEQQAAAAEGASEQAQHGSDAHGQADQRAAGTPLQEKSWGTSKRKSPCKTRNIQSISWVFVFLFFRHHHGYFCPFLLLSFLFLLYKNILNPPSSANTLIVQHITLDYKNIKTKKKKNSLS